MFSEQVLSCLLIYECKVKKKSSTSKTFCQKNFKKKYFCLLFAIFIYFLSFFEDKKLPFIFFRPSGNIYRFVNAISSRQFLARTVPCLSSRNIENPCFIHKKHRNSLENKNNFLPLHHLQCTKSFWDCNAKEIHIYWKSVCLTLCLWLNESRKFNYRQRAKQRQMPIRVYYIQPTSIGNGDAYIVIRRGLLRCSFYGNGQCESQVERDE